MLLTIAFLGLAGLLHAAEKDHTDLIFAIDDKHHILSLEVEHTWMKSLKGLEEEFTDLSNLLESVESTSDSLSYYAKDLSAVKGSLACTSEEFRVKVKPAVNVKLEELRALMTELDSIREKVDLDGSETEYAESLRDGIKADIDSLEIKMILNENLDTSLNEKIGEIGASVYDRLKASIGFTQRILICLQADLDECFEEAGHPNEYQTIVELSHQLHDYASTYKQYFKNFTAIMLLKQNFRETIPDDVVEFIPSVEEIAVSTLEQMNRDMRKARKLDEPLPVKTIRQAEDIEKIKEEFWHFNCLAGERKDHLQNRDDYEKLFNHGEKDIQVGYIEGDVMNKALILDAVVINPEGCPCGKEFTFDTLLTFGSVSAIYSVVPDVTAHPEWIDPHVTGQAVLNIKGIRELRKTIFSQFQSLLNSGHSTLIVKKMGCEQCKSVMSQVAHIYAEAIKMFSKQGIHAIFFADDDLHTAVKKFLKTF